MQNLSLAVVAFGAACMVLPGAASAFTARDGSRVYPVSDAVFEVVPRGGGIGRNFWCSAGDYAQRVLKAPWQAQVYISRARGPSEMTNRRSAVQFTLQPNLAGSPATNSYGSVNTLARGDNMRVRDAYNFCNQLPVGF